MMGQYFYHQHIRRAVTVFGTLFNNIRITRRDGSNNIIQSQKVPLSYGPTQKFLTRIRAEGNLSDPKLAVKLPRMSFEITSIAYDSSVGLQKGLGRCLPQTEPRKQKNVFMPAGYNLSFELSILSKQTDEALQILEQILPYFQPDYTVTVNEVGNQFKLDMPFVLNGVTMNDDYEGDFTNRRTIIYSLTFDTKVRFYGPIIDKGGVILQTRTNVSDPDMTASGEPYEVSQFTIDPDTATRDDEFTIAEEFDIKIPDEALLEFSVINDGPFNIGESVMGTESGTIGVLKSIDENNNRLRIVAMDGKFIQGETVMGIKSLAQISVISVEELWNTMPKN